ncbi:unnamed protein product, partial [Staurois parvus]
MYTVMYIPAPLYSIIVIGHVYSNYLPLKSPWRWRGCLLSAEESGPLLHLSPQRRCRRSRETGTRLHNEAWSAAAPSSVLAAREFFLSFDKRASGFFKLGL